MKREFGPCVYMMASRRNGTLYTGVTSDLIQRIYQHREGVTPGFTSKHDVKRLVWFEQHSTMEHAIAREKRIKKWRPRVEARAHRARQPRLGAIWRRTSIFRP